MKTIPPPCPYPETGPKYWRSLDQLADTPEFRQWVEREFPAGASEFTDPVSRRHFVKIMSASFALAGLGLAGTGCRKPEEYIAPFSKMPEGYIHGAPQFYATARPTRGSAIPLLVKSSDGRPTKIEGNTEHPINQLAGEPFKHAGTDTFTQASILDLYDPDRAMGFAQNGRPAGRDEAMAALTELSRQMSGNGGEGLAFLLERSSSPSRARMQQIVAQKFPKATWHVFEPVDFDIHRQAATIAFGQSVQPEFHLEKAARIVSLDCDFLGTEEDAFRNIRGFAHGRKISKPEDEMSRLYCVEGLFTLTGANADHRLRIATSQVLGVAAALAAEIVKGNLGSLPSENAALAGSVSAHSVWIKKCAEDLVKNGRKSVVLAGHRQPLAVHLLAAAINSALGSVGEVITYRVVPEPKEKSIADLAKSLGAGQVSALVILGGNPVYNAPADLDFAAAVKKAKTVVRLGYFDDETSASSTWQFPQAHFLESWGDARTADGTLVSIQPLIEPLFGGVTEIEMLARLAGIESPKPHDIVRDTFREVGRPQNFEEGWKHFLHDGFLPGSAGAPVAVRMNPGSGFNEAFRIAVPAAPSQQSLEVVYHRDLSADDGRFVNNGWLQEMPDPITKMTWENVVLLSPATAKTLGLRIQNYENNHLFVPVVKVQVGSREIQGPAWIQPGQADNTIALALGYGRAKTGRIGHESGYNAYKIRDDAASHFAVGAKLSATGATHQLSTTQDHWSMMGRPIIREANLEQFKKQPGFAGAMDSEHPPVTAPMYPNPLDARKAKALHQWGMSIDLNGCVGCSACMLACQSENNIPIVGKEQVWRNREMHWIRIDRYFSSDPKKSQDDQLADPQMVHQPMLCQHCEAAPCENVCPVNATSHDEEGLNVMTYNRCVGTRYCSNNCPYKVRRFNYFDWNKRTVDQTRGPFYPSPLVGKVDGEWGITKWLKNPDKGYRTGDDWELLKLAKNPDVTVRMRGVMEKCTFCLQRLEQAKIAQKVKARDSGDVRLTEAAGTIPKTACQQACPAEAIIFGDISDPESRVSKLKAQQRNYSVLEFLLTKPRLTYLARVRNPNPEMPDYHSMPLTTEEFAQGGENPFEEHGAAHAKAGETSPGAKGGHE